MSIGAQIEFVSRLRVQTRDYLPARRVDGRLAGALVGVASIANPFLGFGDRAVLGWPSASFARDMSALSQDFWGAIGDYTRATDDAQSLPDRVVG